MEKSLEGFKGIHPGFILERELQKRSIRPAAFAVTLNTHRQIISAFIKGKRGLSIPMSLEVDQALGYEEGTFALLQVYYEIEQTKKPKDTPKPDLKNMRKVLFWDTNIENINWQQQYKAVIRRVFERGNKREQNEIIRFYGAEKVKKVLSENSLKPMTLQII
ncbi:MAG: plasmid maintenance system antidote protein [Bacteroidetes bacterium]|jgi:plasmid maintenance system antidote protein VapI|nr:plasmid maintenance system antidote protein [Bacteroidota bacterium]